MSPPVGPLPVSDIIEVSVTAATSAIAAKPFNQGLIIGPSTVIPSYGAGARLQQFANLAEMLTAGFTNASPEYIAAELYFGQNWIPEFVWIGRQDLTAIQTANPHSGNAGTGYQVGDQITVVQGGGSNGVLTVLTVGESGNVTGVGTTIGNQGTGYAVANGLSTTGGSGTGLEVDITAVGETYLQAAEACYQANQEWYGFMCCNAADSDHETIAPWASANWLNVFYFGSTSTAAVVNGTASNVALQLQAQNYKVLLSYNTTQGGTYPNNAYAAAAILGAAMGLNTGLANSYFTLNLKQLTGVAPEPLTQTQLNTLQAANCNTCVDFGPYNAYFYNGVCSSGSFFDQYLNRAMLVNMIQTNLMNLLTSVPSVPQTNAGEAQLISQVNQACSAMATIGYIGPGTWTGQSVLNLQPGDTLPLGYSSQAQSYAFQSAGNRADRQAMPIYSSIIEAGAVQSVQVNVYVEL